MGESDTSAPTPAAGDEQVAASAPAEPEAAQQAPGAGDGGVQPDSVYEG